MLFKQYVLYYRSKSLSGFTLIELVVVMLIMGVLAAVAMPIYWKQVEKSRTTEATYNLSVINRAQQAYRWENAVFASSIAALGMEMPKTQYYDFIMVNPPADATQAHHFAQVKPEYSVDLKSYAGSVYRVGDTYIVLICEGNTVSSTPVITNYDKNDPNSCTDGKFIGK